MNSPIKYFGGKGGGLGQNIYKYFPSHSQYDTYIEPFGGGGSMLFLKERYGSEIYNDLEENVYSFFRVLSDEKLFEEFKSKCDLTIYSRQVRDEFVRELKSDSLSLVDRAYKFFIVNRTSINGVGGFSVTTNYIRRGMSKSISDFLSSIEGLRESHDRLSGVIIEKMDGIDLIKKYDKHNVFIYADPPYHQTTRTEARYKVDMDNEAQTKFIDTLIKIKHAMVLVSGYDCDEYGRLDEAGWTKSKIIVHTISGDRKPKDKTEYLWQNYVKSKDEDFIPARSKNKTHDKRSPEKVVKTLWNQE